MKKYFLMILVLILSQTVQSAQNGTSPTMLQQANSHKVTQWVDSVFNTMNLDERIGQTITVVIDANNNKSNRAKLTSFIQNQHIGGVLFSEGRTSDQVDLTNLGQSLSKVPLLITLDGEWGLSMRLENTTHFPRNMMLGAIQGNDSLMYYYGREVARQCKLMGVNVNFAPVLDVNNNPLNPVIGTRSFGDSPDRVATLSILYAKGLEAGGIMSVAKHFPGHGDASTDSHKTLPLISRSRSQLDSVELYPFKKYITEGLSGIMVAHLCVPALDTTRNEPTSLSKKVVTDLLKDELGFKGLIFTDGLQMKGVSSQRNMAIRALSAGDDILLGPTNPEMEFDSIKTAVVNGVLPETLINEKCKKILTYKYLLGEGQNKTIDKTNLSNLLNTPYADYLTRELNKKAITLLKNEKKILPLKNLDKRKIAVVSIGASGNDFAAGLKRYGDVTDFSVTSSAKLVDLKDKLAPFNTIIIALHSNAAYQNKAIRTVCAHKSCILVFLTTPYRMSSYKPCIEASDAVIESYENTKLAQDYTAQAIFGGNPFEGKLPISVADLYNAGDGLTTTKTRLAYGVPEDVQIASSKLNPISDIVKEGISKQAFPGCEILIAKDGVIIYQKSFGTLQYDQKEKVKNIDLYDIASMSKASSTLPSIMKLYDEKKIHLTDPISKYVNELDNTNKSEITLREALFHESGLTPMISFYTSTFDKNSYSGSLYSNVKEGAYTALLGENTYGRSDIKLNPNLISKTQTAQFNLHIANDMYGNNDLADTVTQAIIRSKLGSKRYRYSDLNFILLKDVVEQVSKTNLNNFVQTNFFRKLGSTTTTYLPLTKYPVDQIAPTEQDDFWRKQLVRGYVHDEAAAILGGVSGNAGIFSDANDLAKLYQMWLNGGVYGGERYLSQKTCNTFTITTSSISRRGLGFDKPEPRPNKISPCSPSTPLSVYGHTGFTGTCFWIDPDNKLIFIFLSNRVNPSRTHLNLMNLDIRPRIQETIYKAIKK